SRAFRARACVVAALAIAFAPRASQADEARAAEAAIPPRPIDTPDVPYPEHGKGDAVVILRLTVDGEGKVTRAKAASGAEPFASAAEAAAMGWRFVPARRGERAVASIVSLEIVFHA